MDLGSLVGWLQNNCIFSFFLQNDGRLDRIVGQCGGNVQFVGQRYDGVPVAGIAGGPSGVAERSAGDALVVAAAASSRVAVVLAPTVAASVHDVRRVGSATSPGNDGRGAGPGMHALVDGGHVDAAGERLGQRFVEAAVACV